MLEGSKAWPRSESWSVECRDCTRPKGTWAECYQCSWRNEAVAQRTQVRTAGPAPFPSLKILSTVTYLCFQGNTQASIATGGRKPATASLARPPCSTLKLSEDSGTARVPAALPCGHTKTQTRPSLPDPILIFLSPILQQGDQGS